VSITKKTTIEYAWHGIPIDTLSPTELLGSLAWTCAEIDRLKNPKIPVGFNTSSLLQENKKP